MSGKTRGYDVVRADLPDLRDKLYEPTLRKLAPTRPPDWLSSGEDGPAKSLRLRIHDQGDEGSCIAHSLAALIDVQKFDSDTCVIADGKKSSSARMLFRLATEQQLKATGSTEFFMLRPAIKAFYHNGVCRTCLWEDDDVDAELTVDRAKDARNTGLGAYYRLRPVLNDYHAAINETDAILVAALIHSGWDIDNVAASKGVIVPGDRERGGHAFVIVGYDRTGFYVLNSWGPDWGGHNGLPGIAHWSYADWADSIMDAYVLRLAVPTPDAFDLTIGEQGFGAVGAIEATRVRRFDVVGHYAHLDDGCHVGIGTFPSGPKSVDETVDYLGQPAAGKNEGKNPYTDILLRIAGGTEDTENAMRHVAKTKQFWKENGIYPYSIVWCSDFIAEVTSVLVDLLERTTKTVADSGPAYNRAAEMAVRGIGRAFWRDLKNASRWAARPRGDAFYIFERFVDLCSKPDGYRLHIVAEGAGAILLMDLLAACEDEQLQKLANAVSTLSLVGPACRLDTYQAGGSGYVQYLVDKREHEIPAALYRPAWNFETRMHVGRYSKSILHLIANAFEEWAVPDIGKTRDSGLHMGQAQPPLILGMGRARTKDDEEGSKKVAPMKTELTFDRSRDLPARKAAGGLSVVEIEAPKGRPGPFEFQDFIYHPDIQADILKRIRSDAANR